MIDVFLTQVMPKTRDLDELKAMLCLFYLLDQRRTHSSFVTYKELLSCITSMIEMGEETLRRVLNLAVGHGILRRIEDETGEAYELVSSLTSRGNIFSLYSKI